MKFLRAIALVLALAVPSVAQMGASSTRTGHLRIGDKQHGTIISAFSSAPSTSLAGTGAIYYNTTDDIYYLSNGTTWTRLAGTGGISLSGDTLFVDADLDTWIEGATDDQIDIAAGGQDPAFQLIRSGSISQAVLNSSLHNELYFAEGGTNTYGILYNGTNNTFRIWSTNCDGAGADCAAVEINDGTDDLEITTGNLGVGTSVVGGHSGSANVISIGGGRAHVSSSHSAQALILGSAVHADTGAADGMIVTETNSGGGAPSAIQMTNGDIEFHALGSGTDGAAFDNELMRVDGDDQEVYIGLTGTVSVGPTASHAGTNHPLNVGSSGGSNVRLIGRDNGTTDEASITFQHFDGATSHGTVQGANTQLRLLDASGNQSVTLVAGGTVRNRGDSWGWYTGNDDDSRWYHTGAHGYIVSNTGKMIVIGSTDVRLEVNGGEAALDASANGKTRLYYDNTLSAETISGGFGIPDGQGVTIGDGTHYPDSETVEGVSPELNLVGTAANDSWAFFGRFSNDGAGPALVLGKTRDTSIGAVSTMATSGDDLGSIYFMTPDQSTWQTGARIFAEASATHVNATSGGVDIVFHVDPQSNDVGNVIEAMRINQAGGVTNPRDSGGLYTGASSDLRMYHDGTHSYVNTSTGNLLLQGSNDAALRVAGTELAVNAAANGATTLYYNASSKLATASGGVTVTGLTTTGTLDMTSGSTSGFTMGPSDEGEIGATALGLFLGADNSDDGVYFLVGGGQEGVINATHVSMGDDAGDSLVVGATAPANRQFTVNSGASWTGFNAGDASLSNSSSPSMKENITAIQAATEAAVAAALLDSSASYLFTFRESALRNPADLVKAAQDTLTVPERVAEVVARLERERAYIDTVDSTVTPERRDTSYVGLVDTVATVDTVALVENVRRVVASVDTVVLPSPVDADGNVLQVLLMRVDTTWTNVGDTTWTVKRGRQVVPRGVAVPDTLRDTLEVVGGGTRVLTKIGTRFIPELDTLVKVTPRQVQYATERFLGVVASSERDAITDSIRSAVMADYNRRVKSINDRASASAARQRVGPMADEFAAVARAMGMPASDVEVNGDVYREALRIALRVQQRRIDSLEARVAALEGR